MQKLYEIDQAFSHTHFLELTDEFCDLYNHICMYKRDFIYHSDLELQYPLWGCLYKPSDSGQQTRSKLGDNLQLLRLAQILKIKAQKILKKRLRIYRINTNVQFFGMESTFHTDGGDKDWTFLVCANADWSVTWGGPFVVHTGDHPRDYKNVVFLPNKGILFRADLDHYGSAPNRICVHPRLTLAVSFSEVE